MKGAAAFFFGDEGGGDPGSFNAGFMVGVAVLGRSLAPPPSGELLPATPVAACRATIEAADSIVLVFCNTIRPALPPEAAAATAAATAAAAVPVSPGALAVVPPLAFEVDKGATGLAGGEVDLPEVAEEGGAMTRPPPPPLRRRTVLCTGVGFRSSIPDLQTDVS